MREVLHACTFYFLRQYEIYKKSLGGKGKLPRMFVVSLPCHKFEHLFSVF